MKYVLLLGFCAVIFLICFLIDKLIQKLFPKHELEKSKTVVRPPRKSAVFGVLLLVFPLMALLFWLSAVTLEKKSRYDEVFRPMRSDFICNTIGAIGLGAGCVLSMQAGGTFVRLIGLLGLVSALALLLGGVFRMKPGVPSAMFYVPAILYYVCKLFYDFRRWMHDPAILDYCFCLFALICFMIATYHAASFSFDHGGRRRLCFYSLCGVFFGATAMAGQDLSGLLIYGASACVCLAYAMQALGNGK